ncbi:hypothetical protein [Mesorhizobium silamurunense]|nr:hypothetical protein [Mesorhizobium silamurunense]
MTPIGTLLRTIRAIIHRSPVHKTLAEWAAEIEADNAKTNQERKRR